MKTIGQTIAERRTRRLRRMAEDPQHHKHRAYEMAEAFGGWAAECALMADPEGAVRKMERYMKKMRWHAEKYREVM